MYDRPHIHELIEAARLHLEQAIIPAVQGDATLYFQTLVAINVLKITERELELGYVHAQAAWHGLDALDLPTDTTDTTATSIPNDSKARRTRLQQRNQALSQAIRRGEYDDAERWEKLFAHVKVTTIAQLEVANPRFLKVLATEDGALRTARSTSTHPKVEL
jgi:hypothetical protein